MTAQHSCGSGGGRRWFGGNLPRTHPSRQPAVVPLTYTSRSSSTVVKSVNTGSFIDTSGTCAISNLQERSHHAYVQA